MNTLKDKYETCILDLLIEIHNAKRVKSHESDYTFQEVRKIWHKHALRDIIPLKGFKKLLNDRKNSYLKFFMPYIWRKGFRKVLTQKSIIGREK